MPRRRKWRQRQQRQRNNSQSSVEIQVTKSDGLRTSSVTSSVTTFDVTTLTNSSHAQPMFVVCPDFLDVLKEVEAKGQPTPHGELFYFTNLANMLQKYIFSHQLYDECEPTVVYCDKDPLGKVFGVNSFTLQDARELIFQHCFPPGSSRLAAHIYNHHRQREHHATKPAALPAEPRVTSTTNPIDDNPEKETASSPVKESKTKSDGLLSPPKDTCTTGGKEESGEKEELKPPDIGSKGVKRKRLWTDSELLDTRYDGEEEAHSSGRKRGSSFSLVFGESSSVQWEWVIPLMPSSDDSEILSVQSKETAFARDSSDSWSSDDDDEINAISIQISPSREDLDPPFSEEYAISSDSHGENVDNDSNSDSTEILEEILVVCPESDVDFWADSESSDSESDISIMFGIPKADKWQCPNCENYNTPLRRFCDRCMKIRPDWLPSGRNNEKVVTPSVEHSKEKPSLRNDEELSGGAPPDGVKAEEKVEEFTCAKWGKDNVEHFTNAKWGEDKVEQFTNAKLGKDEDEPTSAKWSKDDVKEPTSGKWGKDYVKVATNAKCVKDKLEVPTCAVGGKHKLEVRTSCLKDKFIVPSSGEDECDAPDKLFTNSALARDQGTNLLKTRSAPFPPYTITSPAKVARTRSDPEIKLSQDTGQQCSICYANRKDGCIVHGKTGHQVCCYECAKKLRRRGKPCPVCRSKIQRVVRNYII